MNHLRLSREDIERALGVRVDPELGEPHRVAADGRPPYAAKVHKAANALVERGVDPAQAVDLLEAIGFRKLLHRSRQRLERARAAEGRGP